MQLLGQRALRWCQFCTISLPALAHGWRITLLVREKTSLALCGDGRATFGLWHLAFVALAVYAASPEVPLYKDIVLMSALNVLVFVRLVLAVQGMAVGVLVHATS